MEKYHYFQGRCEMNSYLSLNPVLYTEVEDGKYQKVKMACNGIQEGNCDREYTCQLLIDAPNTLEDNGVNLRENKM